MVSETAMLSFHSVSWQVESLLKVFMKNFDQEVAERLKANEESLALSSAADNFVRESTLPKYSYNFYWMGRPIIQYPQDIVVMQEIIWRSAPDLIIETGVAHGGSCIFYASMLHLLNLQDRHPSFPHTGSKNSRKVVAIDVEIRSHNRLAIESHPL